MSRKEEQISNNRLAQQLNGAVQAFDYAVSKIKRIDVHDIYDISDEAEELWGHLVNATIRLKNSLTKYQQAYTSMRTQK